MLYIGYRENIWNYILKFPSHKSIPFCRTKTLQHFLQNPGQIFDMYARVEDSGGGEVHSTGSRKINLVNSPVESFFVGFWRPLLGQVKLCPKDPDMP